MASTQSTEDTVRNWVTRNAIRGWVRQASQATWIFLVIYILWSGHINTHKIYNLFGREVWCLEYWCGRVKSLYCGHFFFFVGPVFCEVQVQVTWNFVITSFNESRMFIIFSASLNANFSDQWKINLVSLLPLQKSWNYIHHKMKVHFYMQWIWDSLLLLQGGRDGQLYLMKNSMSFVCKYLGMVTVNICDMSDSMQG